MGAGAARASREDGTSLLPVGIIAVLGSSDAGDAVEITERTDGDAEAVLAGRALAKASAPTPRPSCVK